MSHPKPPQRNRKGPPPKPNTTAKSPAPPPSTKSPAPPPSTRASRPTQTNRTLLDSNGEDSARENPQNSVNKTEKTHWCPDCKIVCVSGAYKCGCGHYKSAHLPEQPNGTEVEASAPEKSHPLQRANDAPRGMASPPKPAGPQTMASPPKPPPGAPSPHQPTRARGTTGASARPPPKPSVPRPEPSSPSAAKTLPWGAASPTKPPTPDTNRALGNHTTKPSSKRGPKPPLPRPESSSVDSLSTGSASATTPPSPKAVSQPPSKPLSSHQTRTLPPKASPPVSIGHENGGNASTRTFPPKPGARASHGNENEESESISRPPVPAKPSKPAGIVPSQSRPQPVPRPSSAKTLTKNKPPVPVRAHTMKSDEYLPTTTPPALSSKPPSVTRPLSSKPPSRKKIWGKVFDDNYKTHYYEHLETFESTWERPVDYFSDDESENQRDEVSSQPAVPDSSPTPLAPTPIQPSDSKLKMSLSLSAEKEYNGLFMRLKGLYNLKDFTFLRPVKQEGFLRYNEKPIPRSLMDFSHLSCPDKKKKKLNKLAKTAFETLLNFFNAETLDDRAAAGHAVLCLGFIEPLLRDEVVLQLVKQTTGNPNFAKTMAGWRLLCHCVSHFPPSDPFNPYFLSHLANFAHGRYPDPTNLKFSDLQDAATSCYLGYQALQGSEKQPELTIQELTEDLRQIPGFDGIMAQPLGKPETSTKTRLSNMFKRARNASHSVPYLGTTSSRPSGNISTVSEAEPVTVAGGPSPPVPPPPAPAVGRSGPSPATSAPQRKQIPLSSPPPPRNSSRDPPRKPKVDTLAPLESKTDDRASAPPPGPSRPAVPAAPLIPVAPPPPEAPPIPVAPPPPDAPSLPPGSTPVLSPTTRAPSKTQSSGAVPPLATALTSVKLKTVDRTQTKAAPEPAAGGGMGGMLARLREQIAGESDDEGEDDDEGGDWDD
eukprot:gb/GEZN01001358.1/.p1 GENE.gb/GEZN01001358.1/~~gb/GEZN01001358.1/.p1  ORF type:complete len:935 (-),score=105.65 gb/GEZN01001358.1/:197-3001(-)